jgi:hypothetical protein
VRTVPLQACFEDIKAAASRAVGQTSLPLWTSLLATDRHATVVTNYSPFRRARRYAPGTLVKTFSGQSTRKIGRLNQQMERLRYGTFGE